LGYEAATVLGPFVLPNGEVDKQVNLNINAGEPMAVIIQAGNLPVTVKINLPSAPPFVLPAGQSMIVDQHALAWLPDPINVLYLSNPGAADTECRVIVAKNISTGPYYGAPEFENFETLTLGDLGGTGHYGTTLYLTDMVGQPAFQNFQVFDAVAISESAYQGAQLGGGDAGGYAMPDGSVDPNLSGRSVSGLFSRTVYITHSEFELGTHFKAEPTPAQLSNSLSLIPLGGAGGPALWALAAYTPFTGLSSLPGIGTSIVVFDLTGAPTIVYSELLDAGNILCDGNWHEFYFRYWMDGSRIEVHLDAITREIYVGSPTPPVNPIPVWPEDPPLSGIQHMTGAVIGSVLNTNQASYTVSPSPYHIVFDRIRMEPFGSPPSLGFESFEGWSAPSPVIGAGYYGSFLNPALYTPPGGLVFHSPVVIDTDADSGSNSAFCEHSAITPDANFHIYYAAMADPFTDADHDGIGEDLDGAVITQAIAFRFPDPTGDTKVAEPVVVSLVDSAGFDGTTALPVNAELRRFVILWDGAGNVRAKMAGQHTSTPSSSVEIVDQVLPVAFKDGNWHTAKAFWYRDGLLATLVLDEGEVSEVVIDVDLTAIANVGAFASAIGGIYIASTSSPSPAAFVSDAKWDSYKQRSFGPETFEQYTPGVLLSNSPPGTEDNLGTYGTTPSFPAPVRAGVEVINTDNHTAGGAQCIETDFGGATVPASDALADGYYCVLESDLLKMDRTHAKLAMWVKQATNPFTTELISWDVQAGLGVNFLTGAHWRFSITYDRVTNQTYLGITNRANSNVSNVSIAGGALLADGAWHYVEFTYEYAAVSGNGDFNIKIDAVDYNYDNAAWLQAQPDIPDRFWITHTIRNNDVSPLVLPANVYAHIDDVNLGSF
jgi:hypothetical protein